MTKVVRIHETGGPDVLKLEDVDVGEPGPGQARVRHTAIGLNFLDVYHRTGLYPLTLPHGLGAEAAGVVEAVGPGVEDVAVGMRVAYNVNPPGAYAEARVMKAERLVPVPDGIPDKVAATLMVKGMTAQYLLRRSHVVRAGESIVVHAAAGGVGMFLCQWAKHLGARVFGTVSTERKKKVALEAGCEEVFVLSADDFVPRVKALTGGVGAHVVYDSVGKDTFMRSLDCLRPLGAMVLFGQSSGPVPPVEPTLFGQKGSLFFTRPSLFHYFPTRQALLEGAAEVFAMVQKGVLSPHVHQEYQLRDVAEAHRALEARRTTGSTVLLP